MENIARAAGILKAAKNPLFLSGAGISAESGVPTFRGADGLWKNYRAEDLATPEAFRRDPGLVWEWYNWRKRLIREKEPNAGHRAMADIAAKLPALLCATQNVDGLHVQAGLTQILEMHGNIFRARCNACGKVHAMEDDVLPDMACPLCAKPQLRPDIVWFGEALPKPVLDKIYERLHVCDAILVVGTSGQVFPAAGFAVEVRRRGGHVIEINLEEGTRHYTGDIFIRGKAGEVLPKLAEML